MIYLAAGYSVRFGSNKLLYELDGKPMYRHVFDRLVVLCGKRRTLFNTESESPDLTVVTQYPEIVRESEKRNIPCVINRDPSRGISSSLREGIASLKERGLLKDGDWLIFINADQPYLRYSTLLHFLQALGSCGATLAAVSYKGEMMSPCAFMIQHIPELLQIRGDRGGKAVLTAHREEVFLFPADGPEEVEDIDSM